jgi:hypothetical protein
MIYAYGWENLHAREDRWLSGTLLIGIWLNEQKKIWYSPKRKPVEERTGQKDKVFKRKPVEEGIGQKGWVMIRKVILEVRTVCARSPRRLSTEGFWKSRAVVRYSAKSKWANWFCVAVLYENPGQSLIKPFGMRGWRFDFWMRVQIALRKIHRQLVEVCGEGFMKEESATWMPVMIGDLKAGLMLRSMRNRPFTYWRASWSFPLRFAIGPQRDCHSYTIYIYI